ncbi:hypothetical protein A676_04014 [Salmonella enterica subsp. enterica serovar Enteritidis str. 2010K-0262]|uniref:Uncharacterized protein n=1 Tax=Salmonella enteritidis (strain 2009K0958) TaxID=1192586 RepID=A0A656IA77_SALE2|nr:hypothetical protein A673_05065 [Salmonella enterica subsp. enterica serovar Enteritidis str. 2009K0958]EPI80002.1 hypothetical protein A675_04243 [Salmonella enterica subsp. enterica serovar Enteritidis str. 2009K1726]EPI80137.1 hypothetical protein A676_04014 [Salmonella enterica subsp. enterica serovar Enteritidis str. 2010K-0262]EPI93789.1 hypothetical protein A678_04589 [Salmonella enterica subsp. enterica serovar Enteritidis str. 2010K-0271]EPI94768.1 hypothetical protein A677_04716 [S
MKIFNFLLIKKSIISPFFFRIILKKCFDVQKQDGGDLFLHRLISSY